MADPPAKRAKRTDSAAMWDKNESTVAPRSHKSSEDLPNSKRKEAERDGLNDAKTRRRNDERRDEPRRRSRSRDRHPSRRGKSRSRERSTKDKKRDVDRGPTRDDRRERDRDHRPSRRARERSQSLDRHKSSKGIRDRDRPRHRSRSRSPARNGNGTPTRTRSPPKAPRSDRNRPPTTTTTKSTEPLAPPSKTKKDPAPEDAMQVDSKTNGHPVADEDEDSEDALLRKMMGFSTFKSTQNKKIPGNDVYGVRKEKSAQYRQYMNRTGGFNRPLSPSRD